MSSTTTGTGTRVPIPPESPGFTAGFASLDAEIDVASLPVTGSIPNWLRGTLLRNGPALFDTSRRSFRHWFDGQAMLHRFAIADGTVSYRNRVLVTPGSTAVREHDRIGYAEFATDPCASLFGRFFTRFRREPSGNSNVNITRVGKQMVALTEPPMPVEFDPETLDTVGVAEYQDAVGGATSTAHPLTDPRTGDLINVVLAFGRRSEYRVTRQRGTLTREVIAAVRSDRPGYLHSFAVTERYVVIVVHPLVVNPLSFVLHGRPFIDNFRWNPATGTRIVVIDTATGAIRVDTTTGACFAFHHINAFDRPGTSDDGGDIVVLDLSTYQDASIVDAFRLERLRAGHAIPVPRPTRFTVAVDDGSVTSRQLSAEPLELPRVAVSAGREHRFVFGCGASDAAGSNFLDQLVRVDCTTGAALTWNEPGTYPGEPVVVARPARAGGTGAEDDGVVLSVALDVAAGTSCLLVLDAATLIELARATVPHTIPFGFHGGFSGDRAR
ncbi:carotenoid oxygenase family protein [Pseudonocardia sp. DSM 110487]|uniref:carotenoid oxygenase family protein n=1 Tax=Pseudonocardia sp. DSM 110487 TaxID=2865833 RepID=UPI001C6A776D|nr:carotenoid oxygenase family protein [Pseudonocardia sp. DSM 110487]QYN37279.1 carotenoid oxygenase family protein [Pseudonocardia sp. DSM 110487]